MTSMYVSNSGVVAVAHCPDLPSKTRPQSTASRRVGTLSQQSLFWTCLGRGGPKVKTLHRMTDNPGVKAQCPDLRSEAFPAPELLLGLD